MDYTESLGSVRRNLPNEEMRPLGQMKPVLRQPKPPNLTPTPVAGGMKPFPAPKVGGMPVLKQAPAPNEGIQAVGGGGMPVLKQAPSSYGQQAPVSYGQTSASTAVEGLADVPGPAQPPRPEQAGGLAQPTMYANTAQQSPTIDYKAPIGAQRTDTSAYAEQARKAGQEVYSHGNVVRLNGKSYVADNNDFSLHAVNDQDYSKYFPGGWGLQGTNSSAYRMADDPWRPLPDRPDASFDYSNPLGLDSGKLKDYAEQAKKAGHDVYAQGNVVNMGGKRYLADNNEFALRPIAEEDYAKYFPGGWGMDANDSSAYRISDDPWAAPGARTASQAQQGAPPQTQPTQAAPPAPQPQAQPAANAPTQPAQPRPLPGMPLMPQGYQIGDAAPGAFANGMPQFTGSQNLRSSQINPGSSQSLGRLQNMGDRMARQVGAFSGLSGYNPVDPYGDRYTSESDTARSGAYSTLGHGMREAEGAQNNYSGQAYGMLGRAGQAYEGAQNGQRYGVNGTDLSGAYGSLGEAERLARGVGGASNGANSARGFAESALGSLNGTPNRGQLASDAFDLIQQRGAPQYEQELRGVGKKAAALGRMGAGMTTNDLTDVFTTRQRDLDLTRRELANSAAGEELSDRTNRLNSSLGAMNAFGGEDRAFGQMGLSQAGALSGLAGQRADFARTTRGDSESDRAYNDSYDRNAQSLGMAKGSAYQSLGQSMFGQGQDLAGLGLQRSGAFGSFANQQNALGQTAFGQGQGLRTEARGERQDSMNYQLANQNARQSALGSLSGLEGQRYGQEASGRNEYRGERQYQDQMANTANENRFRAAQLQDALQNSASGRNNDQIRLMLAAMGDPNGYANMLMNSSNQQNQTAQNGFGDVSNLLSMYFANQNGGGASALPNRPNPYTSVPVPPRPTYTPRF